MKLHAKPNATANVPRREEAEPNAPRLKVSWSHGVPLLRLDDHAAPPLFQDITPATTEAELNATRTAGIRLLRATGLDLGWHGPNQFDYAALNGIMERVVATHREAVCWLELDVNAPIWWAKAHPEESAQFCLPAESNEIVFASWASRRWLNEAGQALNRLLRHVAGQAWGQNVVGIHLAGGERGTWQHPDAARMPDIGPRMTERFQAWVKDKYRGNTGLLKKAWDDPRADFARLRCPNQKERQYTDRGVFRNVLRSRRIFDYFECFYGAQTEAVLHFASLVKKATNRQVMVGVTFGLYLQQSSVAESGYAFPDAVFDSPDVDIFFDGGTGRDTLALPAGSILLREKFAIRLARIGLKVGEETNAIREAALALTHNAGLSLPAGTPPATQSGAAQLFVQQEKAGAATHKRGSQLAVIVDPAANLIVGSEQQWLPNLLANAQAQELARVGAPYDVYLLSDLFHARYKDNKVTVFLNTFYFSEAERRRVDARVKRSEQTVVWLWGAGINGEDGLSGDNIASATGLKMRLEPGDTSFKTRIVEANDPLTWGIHVGSVVGQDKAVGPTLTITDKAVTRLGANSDNKTVFGVKRAPQWNSILFGTLPISARLLRNVLRGAGCHVWTDGDEAIAANVGLVSLHSERGGTVKLSLPGVHDIHDALTGARLGAEDDLSLALKPHETRLLTLRSLRKKPPRVENTEDN